MIGRRIDTILAIPAFTFILTFCSIPVSATIMTVGQSLAKPHYILKQLSTDSKKCDRISHFLNAPKAQLQFADGQLSPNSNSVPLATGKVKITAKDIGHADPESYLWDLHKKERKAKNWAGAEFLLLAGLQFWAAAEYPGLSDNNSFEQGVSESNSKISYALGVLDVVVGVYELASPTAAKRKLNKLARIGDDSARKEAGYEALKSLSDGALTSRIIGGMVYAAMAGVFLAGQPIKDNEMRLESNGYAIWTTATEKNSPMNYVIGGIAAVWAVGAFIVPSQEEKAHKRFLEEIGKDKNSSLEIGFGFTKYRQVWAAYNF